jgi:IS605 OrfB family transposase
MKLVANIKLKPTREQADLLRHTLERCNEACNWLSQTGFEAGKTRQFDLHKLAYAEARERFDLGAQPVVRCIAKVADAYTTQKANDLEPAQIVFRKHSAQPYDERIVSFKADDIVSIWTIDGRIKVKAAMGKHQRDMLAFRKGEVDLMYVRGKFYLACVCDIDDPKLIDTLEALGVDLGIANIATDSDGKRYTGERVEKVRSNLHRRRAGLQKRGTKAAKRRLCKLSKKQARFQKHENHCISRALVETAQRTGRAIGLEDLKHIRRRVTARRGQRARLSNWAFAQLRQFIEYKARRAGVPVLFVDPRYTSKGCPCCGIIDDKNRRTQATFSCVSCGHEGHADHIAARNIRSRAEAALRNPALSSASLAA